MFVIIAPKKPPASLSKTVEIIFRTISYVKTTHTIFASIPTKKIQNYFPRFSRISNNFDTVSRSVAGRTLFGCRKKIGKHETSTSPKGVGRMILKSFSKFNEPCTVVDRAVGIKGFLAASSTDDRNHMLSNVCMCALFLSEILSHPLPRSILFFYTV